MLAALWLAVNSLLAALAAALARAPLQFQFLGRLLHMWGAASAVGFQALVRQLQLVASGALLAPAQMERYRQLANSLAWSMLSTPGSCRVACVFGVAMWAAGDRVP